MDLFFVASKRKTTFQRHLSPRETYPNTEPPSKKRKTCWEEETFELVLTKKACSIPIAAQIAAQKKIQAGLERVIMFRDKTLSQCERGTFLLKLPTCSLGNQISLGARLNAPDPRDALKDASLSSSGLNTDISVLKHTLDQPV